MYLVFKTKLFDIVRRTIPIYIFIETNMKIANNYISNIIWISGKEKIHKTKLPIYKINKNSLRLAFENLRLN